VVAVDVQVALGLDLEVDQAVAGDLLEHVVEEADAGGELRAPVPSRSTLTRIFVSLVSRCTVARRRGGGGGGSGRSSQALRAGRRS
jgi:hypothetical protein